MFSRFSHVLPCISTSFPCMAEQCSTVWIHHILLPIHQPLHIWLVSIFYPSWIMNGALNICVQFLMWMYVFISFGDKTRHRISESYGNSVFNSPTSPQVVYEGSNFSTSSPTLAIFWCFCFVLFLIDTLVGVKWYFIVVLICISLMTSACWPFVYLFWRTVYSNPSSIIFPLSCTKWLVRS